MNLQYGDVVLFHKRSLLGRLIRRFSTHPSDTTPTRFEHVGEIGDPCTPTVIEAKSRVQENDLNKYLRSKRYHVLIARRRDIRPADRLAIAANARKRLGQKYGWLKIAGHLGDYYVSKIKGSDVYFFRRLCRMDKYPICSWVVAWAYFKVLGYLFHEVLPQYCQPDDIADDIMQDSGQWEIIHES